MATISTLPSFYDGQIAPGQGVVFVFGSNPEGRHGAGAAKYAADLFGAVQGRGEGLQGNSYAIPTKNLGKAKEAGIYSSRDAKWGDMCKAVLGHYRTHPYSSLFSDNPYERSISPESVVASIMKMYQTAESFPDRRFMVAYTNARDEFSLNGYCGGEMAAMFAEAGKRLGHIPGNVRFSSAWKGLFAELLTESNDKNHNTMQNNENTPKAPVQGNRTEAWLTRDDQVNAINKFDWKALSAVIDPYFLFGLKKDDKGLYRFDSNCKEESKPYCLNRLQNLLKGRPVFVSSIQVPGQGPNAPTGSALVSFSATSGLEIHWSALNNADGTKRDMRFTRELSADDVICIDNHGGINKWLGDPDTFAENLQKRIPGAVAKRNICVSTKEDFERFRATGYCGVKIPMTTYRDGAPVTMEIPALVQLDREHSDILGNPQVFVRSEKRILSESRAYQNGKELPGQHCVRMAAGKGKQPLSYIVSESDMKVLAAGGGIDVQVPGEDGSKKTVHCQLDIVSGSLRQAVDYKQVQSLNIAREHVNKGSLKGSVHGAATAAASQAPAQKKVPR